MKLNCSCDATVHPEQEALGAGRGGHCVLLLPSVFLESVRNVGDEELKCRRTSFDEQT